MFITLIFSDKENQTFLINIAGWLEESISDLGVESAKHDILLKKPRLMVEGPFKQRSTGSQMQIKNYRSAGKYQDASSSFCTTARS
ncbi:unnamed protein product [Brassica rapa]|uniref:Uncharacterized protein n=1 Tax=Brassica campestris TaxID=3711 RepID=A0A8D9I1M3_BRACM|nr:unnamed protein product [Brassica rapa]